MQPASPDTVQNPHADHVAKSVAAVPAPLRFDQLHIDIARNATDDFNPFHDPVRWRNIAGNPFSAPIALGFLCRDRIMRHRMQEGHTSADFPFRNFEFNFAGALHAEDEFSVDVRRTVESSSGGRANRVVIRSASGSPCLIGTQSDTDAPRFSHEFAAPGELRGYEDRSLLPDSDLFLKRKFLTTSNAKNFALACLCRQQDYIDELAERVSFAPLFTAALMSCALLERARSEGHDFEADPLVYTSHQISVDLGLQQRLRSNDALHFLVTPPRAISPTKGLGKASVEQQSFDCVACLDDGRVLIAATRLMAPGQRQKTFFVTQLSSRAKAGR